MTFKQFMSIIRARKVLVIATALTTVTVIVGVSLVLPKRYTSTGAVVIDFKTPDPINGSLVPGAIAGGYLATQANIIKSERVVLRVIKALKLDQVPALRQQWEDDTDGQGVFDTWLADVLVRKLDVTPAKEASIINVSYTATDPQFAAAMTNAFIKAYMDTTVELRTEPAKRFSGIFEEQTKAAREKLETAQTRLSEYQKANGLLVTDERLDVENARLADLSTQLVSLQTMAAESASRKSNAGANSTEALNNPVIAALKADLSRQEARLKELNAQFGPAHPQVQALQANIGELRVRIDSEIARVTGSLGINNTVNMTRAAQTQAALQAQREKLLKLKAQRDEASVLMRDVENAQRTYETMQARLMQMSLESQSNQTTVSLLQTPTPPSNASFPKIFLNTIASIFLGAMLGVALAILKEARNRKLRSEEDFEELIGMPLLGTMPIALEAKKGALLPVKSAPRLTKRSLPELTAPKKA
ncbi:chain-length determining protein [Aquabacterium sp. NJ1]|uniref:chain length determinant protein EpsF n=1 Tax=Aquabacterium sp. NJ1 TaxID=1538295 RepID=UPI00052C9E50|nr:chain length determinant protein EpsF [Aquabacterium sp. NJ1]KGM40991.1 chain-length determining protein [Aquabacterium sp. NJ1]